MNYTHKSMLALCAAFLLTSACKKSDYDGGNNTILSDNSAALLEVFQPAPATFSVMAGIPKEVLGPQGTYLRFYPASFRDKNGSIITGGMVNVELTEIYTAGDILKYHTSTNTGSTVLTSGGQAYIKATMNGEEITANVYGIGFNADRTPTTGHRQLAYGNNYAADGVVTWQDGSSAIGQTTTGAGPVAGAAITLPSARYYMFDSCRAFNWVAGNHTYSGTYQHIKVNVKLANGDFAGKVWSAVYTGLATERVATVLHQESFDRDTQIGVYKGWVPTGTAVKIMVVIPRDKNTWYYYKTSQALTNGITLNATLMQASKDEMNAAINGF